MMEKSTDPRHEARRVALATLFGWSFLSTDYQGLTALAIESFSPENIDRQLLNLLVQGVIENREIIDKIIEGTAPQWPIAQIGKIDLICLRIAIFELYIKKNVPPKVAIDEAVELAKEFGNESSGSFVNGALGTVVKTFLPQEDDSKEGRKEKDEH